MMPNKVDVKNKHHASMMYEFSVTPLRIFYLSSNIYQP